MFKPKRTPNANFATNESFLRICRPKLQTLEELRVEKLAAYNWRKKIAVPVGAVITPILGFVDYWLILLQRGNDDTAVGLTFIAFMALWGWVTQPKRQYAKAYKTEILPQIASLFGDFTYSVKSKIPMDVMKSSKIMPHHTSYKSEDHFEGDYKGVGIQFSEIKLTKKSGKRTVTVFNGLAVLLSHGTRKFHGHTILTQDQGKVGEWFKSQVTNLKRANLVDPEFERLFDVYTNDQVEARYLIDPLIIENLKALYEEYNGDNMRAAFYDGHFLILIESADNHFEPAAIDVPATDENELLSMKREIGQILSIVDRLSLYDARKRRREEMIAKSAVV